MPRLQAHAPLADPDEIELREQATRRRIAVRIYRPATYRCGGKPIELYAKDHPSKPLLGAFADCGAALEWLTAGQVDSDDAR